MYQIDRDANIQDMIALYGDFSAIQGTAVYENGALHYDNGEVEVTVCVKPHASGVTWRQDSVKNCSNRPITLTTALSRFVLPGGEYQVYTQFSQNVYESQGAWQELHTETGVRSSDLRCALGGAPFGAVYSLQTDRGMAFHVADNCLYSIQIRRQYRQSPRNRFVLVELGADPTGFAYTLQPGETLQLPAVLYYTFRNRKDMDAYKLHRWCKDHFMPKTFPVVYNSWMSKFDLISPELLSRQLELAQEMGLEYFVVDAGWFGETYNWFKSVGDWQEDPRFGMKGEMAAFAQAVRDKGLKFGLWFEAERAALTSRAYNAHPEYYIVEQDNAFLNFADPAAVDYIYDAVATQAQKNGIEYIKFDFNARISYDPTHTAFLRYFAGYDRFIRQIRQNFPGIYIEGCASGGMRTAVSTLQYFDSYWLTDNQNQHQQLRIFKDTVLRMPPRALDRWVTVSSLEDHTPSLKGEQTHVILSGDSTWRYVESVREDFLLATMQGGPVGISCDLTMLTEDLRRKLKAVIAQRKTERSYWLEAETRILTDTPSVLVLQFSDEAMTDIRIAAYFKCRYQNYVSVYPVCDPAAVYQTEDGTQYTASHLDEQGLRLTVPAADLSAVQLRLKKV